MAGFVEPRTALYKTWMSQGREYTGVAVFAYGGRTDDTLTTGIIPRGSEPAWSTACEVVGGEYNDAHEKLETQAWNHDMLKKLHGSTLKTWPDILYTQDFGHDREELVPLDITLWRVALLGGPAVNHIRSYLGTYVITWEHEEDPGDVAGKPALQEDSSE